MIIPYIEHDLEIVVYNKLVMFSEYIDSFLDNSPRVFFDLDIVIRSNIDHIITFNSAPLTVIQTRWRNSERTEAPYFFHPYNSSCMTWKHKQTLPLWQYFEKDKDVLMYKWSKGMDYFLFHEKNNLNFKIDTFPEMCFYSFVCGVDREIQKKIQEQEGKVSGRLLEPIVKDIPIILFNTDEGNPFYRSIYNKYYAV